MTRYRVTLDRKAEKQIRAIRVRWLAEALQEAILGLAENPRPPGCLKMSGREGTWRIRVGDWRIVLRTVVRQYSREVWQWEVYC